MNFDLYRQQQNAKLPSTFATDLFDELGISGNPKADALYRIAWDMGHAYGYEEVYSIACELVPLILPEGSAK